MDAAHVDKLTPLPQSGLLGASAQTSPAPVHPRGRDRGAYAALLGMIESTGAFEEVIFGDASQRARAGAAGYPLAVVTPKSWEESDDHDPTLLTRQVSFAITILIKSESGGPEFDALDLLASTIQDVVDGSDLGGISLAALTRIRSGRYAQAARYPEQSIELEGSFTTLIDPLAPPTA